MRATVTALTALVVSTLTLNAASAQMPAYPVQPAAYGGYGAYPGSGGPAPSAGPVVGTTADGGCSSCGGKGNALCAAFKGWLCRPCPSDAPMLRKDQYPLGFPTHPYARSPRDYFMYNDP